MGRPRGVGRGRPRSRPTAGHRQHRPAHRARRRPGFPARPRLGQRRPGELPDPGCLVPGPHREPPAVDRLLLARVRHQRGAPPVLGGPRRPRRRPPQGGQRSRAPPDRHRPDVPQRLLPPSPQRRGVAGAALPEPGSVRDGAHPPRRSASAARPRRRDDLRPDLEGRGRPHDPVPARHRRRREQRHRAQRHRPPLRRRQRAPTATGDPPRHRRRPGPSGPGCRHPGVPHQRGPRRLPRPRAHPRAHGRRRPPLRGRHRGGPGRQRVHHPHAGARRHRPVPRRAHREVLRYLGRRGRRRARRPAGSGPRARRHGG